jgi:hypothetical protein
MSQLATALSVILAAVGVYLVWITTGPIGHIGVLVYLIGYVWMMFPLARDAMRALVGR